MHTGRLIDELMETVERAEEQAYEDEQVREAKLAYWYAAAQQEMARFEQTLLGAA